MKKVIIIGNFYKDDLKYVVGEEPLDVISLPYTTSKKEIIISCNQADLFIFKAVGQLPTTIAQEFASAGLLEQFNRLSIPKVFWSQDSHHAHVQEARGQKYFDRFYIAHANYLDKFDQARTYHLPCCYGASSLDFLRIINSKKFETHFDIGNFYVQYNIGDRNLIIHKAKNIIEKRNLSYLFGKLYGAPNGIPYGNMLCATLRTDIILNIPILDDLNIRNFEAIAFNKKLLTNELNEHKLVDLDYSNTLFINRNMSDFEDILMDAVKNKNKPVKTWESVYNGNCLIHRYINIINSELGTKYAVITSDSYINGDTDAKIKTLQEHEFMNAQDVEIYSNSRLFAGAFVDIFRNSRKLKDATDEYNEAILQNNIIDIDEFCKSVGNFFPETRNNSDFSLFLLSFLVFLGKFDVAAAVHRKNLYADFISAFKDNREVLAKENLQGINGVLFDIALHALGILNWENDNISGEYSFLNNVFKNIKDLDVVFFDIGANKGSYSSLVRSIYKNARIYAFEPNKAAYNTLKTVGKRGNIFCFNIGMSNTAGNGVLYDRAGSSGSVHASLYSKVISEIHHVGIEQTNIKLTTIDSFMEQASIDHIHLLKIDTEGHELEVLRGAQLALKNKKISVIQFEFNEMNVVSRVFMKDFFDLLPGYSFFRLLPDGMAPLGKYSPVRHEIFAFQNIVALLE